MAAMKLALLAALLLVSADTARAQQVTPVAESDSLVSIRLLNTDLRAAVQLLSPYLDRPVLFSGASGAAVTLETPQPVHRREIERILRGLLESQNYQLVVDSASGMFRAMPRELQAAARQASVTNSVRAPGAIELFVIPLQHARATDVASTINALYGRSSIFGSADGGRPSTLADDLRSNLVPPTGAPGGAAPQAPTRTGQLSGELTIVADQRANSLLVRANNADIELIRGVVQALDVRPLQVLIEVLIAEVRRDRSIGVNTESELGPTTLGNNGATIEGALGEGGLGDFALRVMGLGSQDLTTTLRLASGRGNVRILTRPVVLATNNESAEIVVGSQRPFVQVQRSLPTDNASRDQVVQYKDVGTKLTVRPTISNDGSVQLEVTQEVSTATSELAFNAPVIATRSVRTQLLVHDGQTVALGGLTDRQREARQGGLPILSSIPLIGGLFGRASRQTIETELFVFITPRVIRTDEDATRISEPLRERAGDRP
jgi:general secretion pathway protein D